MAKIGRNDPCPCGSGKKYKNCCYGKQSAWAGAPETYATDPDWVKIRRTEAEVTLEVLKFAVSRYGEDFLNGAMDEFSVWGKYDAEEIETDAMFFPWAAFNWVPDFESGEPEELEDSEASEDSEESDEVEDWQESDEIEELDDSQELDEPEDDAEELLYLPAGVDYLAENIMSLAPYQKAFIVEACSQPYSFFVVTSVTEGKSLGLRDIFLSRTFTVKESAASKSLKRGDIIFTRVIELEGQAIMLGMAPTMLEARCHGDILDLRDAFEKQARKDGLKLNQALMLELDLEMRSIYFDLLESMSNPAMPELRNTDGDPLKFIKLYFKLDCTPQQAVDSLKPLGLPEQQDVLADAVYGADGNLAETSFNWLKLGNKANKNWQNTVLGTLRIKDGELTAEVNSENRAEKIKSEIAKRLKKRAAFQNAVVESIEDKLKEQMSQAGNAGSELERAEMEEFQSRPEVQEMVRKHMEAQWEEWYSKPVPALNNKTPLQAAKTKSGRERLEALLLEFENIEERNPSPHPRPDIAQMRKRLGLPE
ncbi:MAG TPA: SEC-C metal-binding domain-containing protein [Blastocatellia bacterium]